MQVCIHNQKEKKHDVTYVRKADLCVCVCLCVHVCVNVLSKADNTPDTAVNWQAI